MMWVDALLHVRSLYYTDLYLLFSHTHHTLTHTTHTHTHTHKAGLTTIDRREEALTQDRPLAMLPPAEGGGVEGHRQVAC
jgi:hypothetical protein